MNTVILMGRLTRDPEMRQTTNGVSVATYTLAVDRRGKDAGADFIRCVAYDKAADFAGKYFRHGQRVLVSGRIQTGSYTNREGQKVYTTDVILATQEFADSKNQQEPAPAPKAAEKDDGFLSDPVDEDFLPFN